MHNVTRLIAPIHDAAKSIAQRLAQFVRAEAGLLAVLAFTIVFLAPLLRSGFYDDDMMNSCTAGFMRMSNFRMGQFLEAHIKDWMINGRFFPMAVAITYVVHRTFSSAGPYKAFLLFTVLTNVVQLYYLLRVWKVNRTVAQLAALSFVLLMQMRLFPDPILSFASLMQFLTGELLLSIICLQKYFDTNRAFWMVASALLFLAALVTYEVSYLFLPIYLAIAYAHHRQWWPTVLAMRPHLLMALFLAAFVLGLRMTFRCRRDILIASASTPQNSPVPWAANIGRVALELRNAERLSPHPMGLGAAAA